MCASKWYFKFWSKKEVDRSYIRWLLTRNSLIIVFFSRKSAFVRRICSLKRRTTDNLLYLPPDLLGRMSTISLNGFFELSILSSFIIIMYNDIIYIEIHLQLLSRSVENTHTTAIVFLIKYY